MKLKEDGFRFEKFKGVGSILYYKTLLWVDCNIDYFIGTCVVGQIYSWKRSSPCGVKWKMLFLCVESDKGGMEQFLDAPYGD